MIDSVVATLIDKEIEDTAQQEQPVEVNPEVDETVPDEEQLVVIE